VFDYPRDIQPILDEHCVECHNADQYNGNVNLSGDKTPMYTVSYWAMRTHDLVSDGRNEPASNYPPYANFSAASRLLRYLAGDHYAVQLSEHQRRMIRLWIDSSATYPGTYAALGCGHYPVAFPYGPMKDRCGGCHGHNAKDDQNRAYYDFRFGPGRNGSLDSVANISHPEKSIALRAPLAKEAGGLERCGEVVFKNRDDPLYQRLLAAIEDAYGRLESGKRFDMPGFRPNEHYIREMQRFGFLPKTIGADDAIDVYAVDRAYWDSFKYAPPTQ
jgi:hypothetical protein